MAIEQITHDHPGIPLERVVITAASQASPLVTTFTLPSRGVWLIVARGQANNSVSHIAASTWLAYWSGDVTFDLGVVQQLGTTAKSTGSTLAGDTILTSIDAATGVITVTVSWLGGNNTSGLYMEARKIAFI